VINWACWACRCPGWRVLGLLVPRLRGVPGLLVPRLGVNWWVPGRLLPVGPGSRPGSRDGLGRGCCTHAPRMLGSPERFLCHQPSSIYLRSDMSRYTHVYIYIYIHPPTHVVRHIYWPVAVKIRVVATSDVPIYLYPATVRVNRHVLLLPRPWTWASSSTPYANWSTPPRDTQHHLADWPTRFLPPTGQSSVRCGTPNTAPPTGQLPPTA
jgi:hypothetical protein